MTSRRWVVREGDGTTVGAIVRRAAPGDRRAIAEGRVFVGRRRVGAEDEAVVAGDEVTVGERTPEGAAVTILKRGEGWVAVDKVAGLPTIPDQSGASHSLLALAAKALGVDSGRLHPTSRLDREVSGVVVFALKREAAEHLHALREAHEYVRRYLAIAARAPSPPAGAWTKPIGRAPNPKLRVVGGKDAQPATTHYEVVAEVPGGALLALSPVTGRTHQIRVHAADGGAPLLGDRAYGGPVRMTLSSGRVVPFERIALHAGRVTLAGSAIESPVPVALREAWLALGGDAGAWDKALACSLPDR